MWAEIWMCILMIVVHRAQCEQTMPIHILHDNLKKKISRFRNVLEDETLKIILNFYVTSKIECCNSLQYGLPKINIKGIQMIQSKCERLKTRVKKIDVFFV